MRLIFAARQRFSVACDLMKNDENKGK